MIINIMIGGGGPLVSGIIIIGNVFETSPFNMMLGPSTQVGLVVVNIMLLYMNKNAYFIIIFIILGLGSSGSPLCTMHAIIR